MNPTRTVRPLACALALAAALGASAAESLSFHGVTDRDPLSYACGEEMVFTVTLVDRSAKNAPVPGRRVAWTLEGDDGSRRAGEASSDQPLVVKAKLDAPGFVHLVVRAVDEDGRQVPGSGVFDSSAAADAERIPAKPAPDDFNAFWDLELARLKSVPMNPVLTPVASKDTNVVVNAFSVNLIPSLGPATGLIAWPRAAAAKSLPIRVDVPGYGYGRGRIDEKSVLRDGGAIRLHITRYGEDPLADGAYHENLWTNVMQGFCWRNTGAKTANEPFLMLLRDVRAVAFAKTMEQWDGRTLTVGGGSMGGYRSIALAALDPDVSRCSPDFAWMCDLAGHPVLGRIGGWFPLWTPELAYVDGVNLAMRVTCPVDVNFGLADYVCPPSGQMILFRNLRGPVKMRYSHCVGHGCGYGVNQPSWTLRRDARTDEAVGLDQWGGQLRGPQLAATGRFRVERRGGSWWIVDPDGRLFRDLASSARPDPAAPARPTPFIAYVNAESRPLWKESRAMRDPFDPTFGQCVTWDFAGRRPLPHSPWCLGLVVDRDVDFGATHAEPARRALAAPADQPARRALLKRLAADGRNYDAAKGPDQLSEQELCGLTDYLLGEYFARTRQAVKDVAGEALYLGCRFSASPPKWVAAAAKGKVDILCGDGVAGWDALPEGLPAGEADLLRWPSEENFDLVVYGSSPAALSAAVQAKRMGLRAVVVSPETRIGGLTTGGLGQTDIGNKSAFGGIALEFYRDVAKWYSDPSHWKWQKPEEYFPDGQCAGSKSGGSMWTFAPSAALAILEGWERRDGLDIRRGEFLDRERGVEKDGARIVAVTTLSGRTYRGRMFVDATYEGDLMAAAGVKYSVGREANSVYGETLNGIATDACGSRHHNFHAGVSPYVVEGDRSSGLLPGVEPHNAAEKPGDGDGRMQAYCFRMCLTDVPENRIPFKRPEGYDERMYELLFREYAAVEKNPDEKVPGCLNGRDFVPLIMSRMPDGKTDSNNRTAFSSDFIGMNHEWPEASYARREELLKAHLDYQRGLMWTLANHPRIPKRVREYFSKWGTCRDEFNDGPGDGWQSQLYVREGRRMVGEMVMTESHCRGEKKVSRPVAMAAYTMDSHHVRRVETADGFVRNEGNFEDSRGAGLKGGMAPYGIDYGAIVPKRGECVNLLVPVSLSASHVAFGSIRMEPVFFALGQAAGTAAAVAVEKGVAVQDVPYADLRRRLVADGQVLP